MYFTMVDGPTIPSLGPLLYNPNRVTSGGRAALGGIILLLLLLRLEEDGGGALFGGQPAWCSHYSLAQLAQIRLKSRSNMLIRTYASGDVLGFLRFAPVRPPRPPASPTSVATVAPRLPSAVDCKWTVL